MTTETGPALVESAVRATYQLSPAGSGRLRRLTSASGLANENVLSRVAIVTSLKNSEAVLFEMEAPRNKGKEIKGTTLLGRTGPASLLVTMIVHHHNREVTAAQLRSLIVAHWERGLNMLNREAGGGSVVDLIAEALRATRSPNENAIPERSGAYGKSHRDQIAASLGREFGVLPIEVRRLMAMVGRFDLAKSRKAAARLISEARGGARNTRVSESHAMKVLDGWNLNRLGMASADVSAMRAILGAESGVPSPSIDPEIVSFLEKLGLVRLESTQEGASIVLPSRQALALGTESWLQ